jgi:hypothetical protein
MYNLETGSDYSPVFASKHDPSTGTDFNQLVKWDLVGRNFEEPRVLTFTSTELSHCTYLYDTNQGRTDPDSVSDLLICLGKKSGQPKSKNQFAVFFYQVEKFDWTIA